VLEAVQQRLDKNRWRCAKGARQLSGLDHYAPNRHDTGSTTARSVDEVALIRDTISHYAPVLIASARATAQLGLVWSPATGINFFVDPAAAKKSIAEVHAIVARAHLAQS
jgi:hypothetical protein